MVKDYAEHLDAVAVDLHTNALNNNLANSLESCLLFYNERCKVISSDTINFIASKYSVNDSEKNEIISTIIDSYFKLYSENVKIIFNETILTELNNIGNEQINYEEVLENKVPLIIMRVTDYYNLSVLELYDELKEIDNTYLEEIKSYFNNTVSTKIISILRENIILYIRSTMNRKKEEDDKLTIARNTNAEIISIARNTNPEILINDSKAA